MNADAVIPETLIRTSTTTTKMIIWAQELRFPIRFYVTLTVKKLAAQKLAAQKLAAQKLAAQKRRIQWLGTGSQPQPCVPVSSPP